VRTTSEEKKRQYYIIYRLLDENPRVFPSAISKVIRIRPKTAGNRVREAFDEGYISEPNVRKNSYLPFVEYVYFVRCEDSLEQYLKFSEDERIVYHAVMDGFANLWVISKEEIDIEGDVLISGPRSDYHVAFAPNHSWKTAVKIMEEKVEKFDPDKYGPKGIIQTHWDETVEWDEKDEILYRYFKYDLRKPVDPVRKKHRINTVKFKDCLKKLPEYCTVYTRYFPEGILGYDSYIFVFETDYEDFIIDLFSELPTTSMFFRVSNKLILLAYIQKQFLRNGDNRPISDVSELHIPLLIRNLLKKGIIKSEGHAIVNYHWGKSI